jgi:(S)-ureidoglycine aminohydrolase
MHRATAIIHAAPALGARFTQYTVEFEAGGQLGPTAAQRFLYVLEGEIDIAGHRLSVGGYSYQPEPSTAIVSPITNSRVAVVEKRYESLNGIDPPKAFSNHESACEPVALLGDPDVNVRLLLPDQPQFDFAVHTMTFQPGAALSMVEIHVMEHGLLMLQGGGIYRLDDSWYPVSTGDFIWMGSFCPQWFGALGKRPAKYLIYKDWNRHPLE